ncbi:GIY-YIG nuclease family protein [Vibrio sp. SS-MA-C1-2]|uniref:GIY-YIG nuclease family protein n=1 Tax=Vibrio sp. SS-MA-C1-2 TaxID=2908646 RepID=UPI001F1D8DCF|nr:GIY-YIG nuclease family protein [Vibrio sp. SS-MA-C1-2]UJF17377.1 GIY-YIG nuclease family protein [Vibrio sp. SS-MA-C1-2]
MLQFSDKSAQVWSVYLIKTKLNTLYCGVSTDVARRFSEHCHLDSKKVGSRYKGAKALRGKMPLTLVWQYQAASKQQAMQLEYKIKRLKRSDKDRLVLNEKSVLSLID